MLAHTHTKPATQGIAPLSSSVSIAKDTGGEEDEVASLVSGLVWRGGKHMHRMRASDLKAPDDREHPWMLCSAQARRHSPRSKCVDFGRT